MRKRWWQSIRRRLALGSVLLILLTTGLLAFTAMLVAYFSYDIDRTREMDRMASDMARQVSLDLPQFKTLPAASRDILTATSTRGVYLPIVVNSASKLVYPTPPFKTSSGSTIYPRKASIIS